MKLVLAMLLSIFAFSFSANAEEIETPDQIRGERIAPCDWWNYEPDVRGYICGRRPWTITVTTVDEVQRVIDQLVAKINDLENRVAALEAEGDSK